MSTISELITRTQMTMLDLESLSASRRQVLMQQQDEISRLSREQRYGDILVMRGEVGRAHYLLPNNAVEISHILYSGMRLDYTSEEFLDRRSGLWAARSGDPKYWTTSNQGPNVFQVIPPPQRTGSILPDQPPAPFTQPLVDNFCVFYFRDFSDQADGETDEFPLLSAWEDVLVFRTVSEIARRESPYQNLPLSAMAHQFAELWIQLLEAR